MLTKAQRHKVTRALQRHPKFQAPKTLADLKLPGLVNLIHRREGEMGESAVTVYIFKGVTTHQAISALDNLNPEIISGYTFTSPYSPTGRWWREPATIKRMGSRVVVTSRAYQDV